MPTSGFTSFTTSVFLGIQNPSVIQILRSSLEYRGVECRVAVNAESAYEALSTEAFGVILLEEELFGPGTVAQIRELRRTAHTKDTPILMIASTHDEELLLQAYESGLDDHFGVPFLPSILLEKVMGWLRKWQRIGAAQSAPHLESFTGTFEEGLEVAGRYVLEEMVGKGLTGNVWRARDQRLSTDIAIKILLSNYGTAPTPEQRERFYREGTTLAQLHHPNIVGIHDYGKLGEFRYFTMDYLPGGTLFDRIRSQGCFAANLALRITEAMARALHFAHGYGIIHRDIKSTNILFSISEDPVLVDFGARLKRDASEARLTPVGMALGTPYYMAPEQIMEPDTVDHQADVYGLGVLLYEMLTGQVPFYGLSQKEMMFQMFRQGLESPRKVRGDVPFVVEHVCLTAAAIDRSQRFATAEALARACESARAELLLTTQG